MLTKLFSFTTFSTYHILKTNNLSKPLSLAFASYFYYNTPLKTYNHPHHPKYQNHIQIVSPIKIQQSRIEKQISKYMLWRRKIGNIVWQTLRFFQLLFIFSPSILLIPLRMFKQTQQLWIDIFVNCIERAGVVWIKTFQCLSHRRDIIGQKMANKFGKLRQGAPQHSFEETNKSFERQYGKPIKQIFDKFKETPIASGSVSQVYEAVYKGKKVAVKVRHPGVEKYISRDVQLLFSLSKILSNFSRTFQIPVGQESLKKTLTQQIDFNIQANNLKIFNQIFKNNDKIKFPVAMHDDSRESVLVESFIQGVPVTYYEQNKHKLNKVIARIGANTFFQMLMKYNFIHADCHGGNIMVTIKQKSESIFDGIKDRFRSVYRFFENRLIKKVLKQNVFQELYLESKKQQDELYQLQKQTKKKVQVTLIDVGMVIKLQQQDRKNFVNFLRSIINKEIDECAKMIYSLSIYEGKKISEGKCENFKEYHKDLLKLFSVVQLHTLKQLDGVELLKKMLDLIREYKMKLDGQFATLLTNMLVLDGIAKDLNPDINLLKCAVPYFSLDIQNKQI